MAEKWTCSDCDLTFTMRCGKQVVSFENRLYYLCKTKKILCKDVEHTKIKIVYSWDLKYKNQCDCCGYWLHNQRAQYIRKLEGKDYLFCRHCEKLSRRCANFNVLELEFSLRKAE